MHHLRFTPVRPPLRHRCTTTPPSRPITIPPQPSSWLESSIPPTLAGRECSASSKYLRFVHRPSRLLLRLLLFLLGHRLLSRIFFFFFSSCPLRVLLLLFAVVVLYSRIKRPGRLSSLIASRVTLRETLNFGISFFRDPATATATMFPSDVSRLERQEKVPSVEYKITRKDYFPS